jgi:hypothetical protein
MDIKTTFEMIRAQPDGPVKKFELAEGVRNGTQEVRRGRPGHALLQGTGH